jgi:hypothetical protein
MDRYSEYRMSFQARFRAYNYARGANNMYIYFPLLSLLLNEKGLPVFN